VLTTLDPPLFYQQAEAIAVDSTKKTVTCVLPTGQNEPAAAAPKPVEAKASSGWFGKKAAAETKASGEDLVKSSSRTVKDSARTRPPFDLEYDVLVMAVGAENNTFNTPGR
jgi:NADH dehydrogenase FAD-containing subunit